MGTLWHRGRLSVIKRSLKTLVSIGVALTLTYMDTMSIFAEESQDEGSITIYTNDGTDSSYTYDSNQVDLVLTNTPEGTHFYGFNTQPDAEGEWVNDIDNVDRFSLETRDWKEDYTYEADITKVVDVSMHTQNKEDLYVIWQNNRTVTPYQMKDSFSSLTFHANNGTSEQRTVSPMELSLSNGNLNALIPEFSAPSGLYGFRGWNTKADGSGVWYLPAYVFSKDYDQITELYANWMDLTDALNVRYQTFKDVSGVRSIVQPVTVSIPVYQTSVQKVHYVKRTLPVQTGVTLEWSSSLLGILLASMGIDYCLEELETLRGKKK